MRSNWTEAYHHLQGKYEILNRRPHMSQYPLDKVERAMDYLLNHTDSEAPSEVLISRALGSGRCGLYRQGRRTKSTVASEHECTVELAAMAAPITDETLRFEFCDLLEIAPLSDQDRTILLILTKDASVQHVAQALGSTVRQAYLKIHRARNRGWEAWLSA